MVRRLHAISERPELATALLHERHTALKQFSAMGFVDRLPDGKLHAFGEPVSAVVLRGVINNFHIRLPGGHWRNRQMASKDHKIGDTLPDHTGHSKRYLDTTYGAFFKEIDRTLAAVGICRTERAAFESLSVGSVRNETFASPAIVTPLYDAYRILRFEGYTQKDLTA
ncbi:hypothetical protein HY990_05705 [Candidatus Micrarchaeota archaeon]|nr:hypothetical protein [Candidatus Micrarchaeota archaeon]